MSLAPPHVSYTRVGSQVDVGEIALAKERPDEGLGDGRAGRFGHAEPEDGAVESARVVIG